MSMRAPAARPKTSPPSRHIRSPATKRQRVSSDMTDPTITCPNCKTEIKLTESLAAPLIESIRTQYEERIAEKETSLAMREAAVREQQAEVAQSKEAIDEQVAQKLKEERASIATEEA